MIMIVYVLVCVMKGVVNHVTKHLQVVPAVLWQLRSNHQAALHVTG